MLACLLVDCWIKGRTEKGGEEGEGKGKGEEKEMDCNVYDALCMICMLESASSSWPSICPVR